jgi:hypothetical protein
MSAATLTRFTVPIASDQNNTAQGLLMPKLSYRFRVTLENFGTSSSTNELTKQVIDFKRPSAKFGDIVLDVYNSQIKLAGKATWDDTTLTVRDDATGVIQKLVGEQMQKQFDYFEQASAVSGQDYKFMARCEILDGGNGAHQPAVLETWELYGCYVTSADYGALSYTDAKALQIVLNLKFDNALQTTTSGDVGPGIGLPVKRTSGTMSTGIGATKI